MELTKQCFSVFISFAGMVSPCQAIVSGNSHEGNHFQIGAPILFSF